MTPTTMGLELHRLEMETLRVGYNDRTYAAVRNIIGKAPRCLYRLCRDRHDILHALVERLPSPLEGAVAPLFRPVGTVFSSPSWPAVDVLHLWNGVLLGKGRPWVSTYETVLPRFPGVARDGFENPEALIGRGDFWRGIESFLSCEAGRLIALSDCAKRMQLQLLENVGVAPEAVAHRITVLHPPQPPLLTLSPEDQSSASKEGVRFVLVGGHFFRKGGDEVLQVLQSFRRKGYRDFKLTVVSNLGLSSYATRHDREDQVATRAILTGNPDWIVWYETLPNSSVLQLLRQSHVALLPSHAETYGYFVLEAQAAGCPVITTDVRAFPEINDDRVGWLIPVRKKPRGEALFNTVRDRRLLSEAIVDGLTQIIGEILDDPDSIAPKAQRALTRIRENHDPATYGERLREAYLGSVSAG